MLLILIFLNPQSKIRNGLESSFLPLRPFNTLGELRIADCGLGQAPITAQQPVQVFIVRGAEFVFVRLGKYRFDTGLQRSAQLCLSWSSLRPSSVAFCSVCWPIGCALCSTDNHSLIYTSAWMLRLLPGIPHGMHGYGNDQPGEKYAYNA